MRRRFILNILGVLLYFHLELAVALTYSTL